MYNDDMPTTTTTTFELESRHRRRCRSLIRRPPLFPIVCMPSYFNTCVPLEKTKDKIAEILKAKNVHFEFVASQSKWECNFLDMCTHLMFEVQLYRYPKTEPQHKHHHAIEMHRLEGDGLVFRDIYESLRDELHDPHDESVAIPQWPKPDDAVWNPPESFQTQSQPQAQPLFATDDIFTIPDFQIPSLEEVKTVMVATLQHGRLTAVQESTQLACGIYATDLFVPEKIDVQCMAELMKIVVASNTGTEWSCQHAVWALRNMSVNADYRKAMLSHDELSRDLVRAVFQFGETSGTYHTEVMRGKCVEILWNLLKTEESGVYEVLGEEKVHQWRDTEFVKSVIQK